MNDYDITLESSQCIVCRAVQAGDAPLPQGKVIRGKRKEAKCCGGSINNTSESLSYELVFKQEYHTTHPFTAHVLCYSFGIIRLHVVLLTMYEHC